LWFFLSEDGFREVPILSIENWDENFKELKCRVKDSSTTESGAICMQRTSRIGDGNLSTDYDKHNLCNHETCTTSSSRGGHCPSTSKEALWLKDDSMVADKLCEIGKVMSYPNFVWRPSIVGMRPLFDHFEVHGTHRWAIREVPWHVGSQKKALLHNP